MALTLTGVLINVSRHGTTLECFINTQNHCQVRYNSTEMLAYGSIFYSYCTTSALASNRLV